MYINHIGDCRLFASVGVYSYYVNRKKSTIVVLHETAILYGRMYDLSIEELSVLRKTQAFKCAFITSLNDKGLVKKISHMIRKIVLLELIISKQVEIFLKITILKKIRGKGVWCAISRPPLDPPVVCIPESACKYSSNARNVPPPPV